MNPDGGRSQLSRDFKLVGTPPVADPERGLSSMGLKSEETRHPEFDCISFGCKDECCQYGADVLQKERDLLITGGMAQPDDFMEPTKDEDGNVVCRTRKGPRGCIFLLEKRGCKLHANGRKPTVCLKFPKTSAEATKAYTEGYLPCFHYRNTMEVQHEP